MSVSDEQQNPGDSAHSKPAPQFGPGGSGGPPDIAPPIRLLTTGLYTGYSPFAPGSVGSLLGILIYIVPGFHQPYVLLPAVAVCFFLGVYGASKMEQLYGRDPQIVVIDEIVGLWISLALLPKHPVVIVLAFFLFRLLDIWKPYPARQSERLGRGWGIMIDDVIAGIYTNLLMRVFLFFYQV